MRSWPVTEGVLELGDLEVERGGVIRDARLAWQAHGTLNAAKDNVIVHPCSYTATHDDLAELIGPDLVLDPERWFIVVPDMFSNGLSSSAADIEDFPALVTAGDNVRAQRRLLDEQWGIDQVAAVHGFSMGAIQAYHWASLFPDTVERAIVVCGSARTAPHNKVFLSGLLRILEAAPEHLGGGRFSAEPVAALRAFGHVYAGWGLSQDFYREELWRTVLGAPDLETYLRDDWEAGFADCRAANLYAQAMTWSEADISLGGDLPAALAAIRARVLLMPSETDLYFRVADNAAELPHLASAELLPIPGIWGHRAGSPAGLPDELDFVRTAVRRWLDA
ncbi:alpha/beta fold hydrolase [Nocardioides rubriscoriae]|uniref:alpha/beta fold hydrolase n=1 Tax=Nocardioides rubriscoriae TaxID=642762 RepID=UPI0011DF80FA|nr:alpha/beta fold hydrolase [Nocardioides rubriscoriae]